MAYMDQTTKRRIAELLKKELKGVDIKYSLAVRNHSTLILTITQSSIDFQAAQVPPTDLVERHAVARPYFTVNHYWIDQHYQDSEAKTVLKKIVKCMMDGNHNRSDIQTDYFDVGWYVTINVGRWGKPFVCTSRQEAVA